MGKPRVPRDVSKGVKPDRAAMATAVQDFLRAAGLPLEVDPNLAETPERVAEAWAEEFLDGYGRTPEEALGETFPAPANSSGEMVVVTDLRFHSMCPHHLLPFEGRAHVAYMPAKRVVGFGRLSALVDCFAHRLILQEDLAREVASSLARVLKSPATACIIEAEQACLRIRGDRQRDARTHAEAYEGLLRKDGALRRELWARLGATRR
ncbi:GTP cyclohydrolase I [Archangium minus]|uniref:GTP cyclohydrolase I n=2 Tax=Archangium minus TaxID=83450 RepID=A0ABY9WZZ8_9BACT|nr:GTP cyclohydrolase I [Archangium minus]